MGQTSYKKGLWAEKAAIILLRLKGYRILEHRYKTPYGEIDVIARRGETIAFVEVKARKSKQDALEAISPKAQKRIYDAAALYLSAHTEYSAFEMRFDVISVMPGQLPIHDQDMWRI